MVAFVSLKLNPAAQLKDALKLFCPNPAYVSEGKEIADTLNIPFFRALDGVETLALQFDETGLSLFEPQGDKSRLRVDFLSGALAYRRQQGIGKGQLLAKALGVGKDYKPTVVDVTAGLGRDAFVMACLGCRVIMIERNPIIHALLADGLRRLAEQEDLPLTLLLDDAKVYLEEPHLNSHSDVIYLDPMFPARKKSALVKKEMRLLRYIVGDDHDAQTLFDLALQYASRRVVVKRSKLAEGFKGVAPDRTYQGKKSRFDVWDVRVRSPKFIL